MRYLRLCYVRDEQGLEVDFVMPGRGSFLSLVECKAGKTMTPAGRSNAAAGRGDEKKTAEGTLAKSPRSSLALARRGLLAAKATR